MDDTKHVDFRIGRDLDLTKRTWIVARLVLTRGIHRAHFDPAGSRLEVDYDPTHFSSLTLLDLLRREGMDVDAGNERRVSP